MDNNNSALSGKAGGGLREKICHISIFLGVHILLYLFLWQVHSYMDLRNDDRSVWDLTMTFKEYFMLNWGHSGRIFCNSLVWFLVKYVPFNVWRVMDCIIYVLVGDLMLYYIYGRIRLKEITPEIVIGGVMVSIFLALFPIIRFMTTAGYIATSSNYIYTLLCVLVGEIPLAYAIKESRHDNRWFILSAILFLYAANQDQYAIFLIILNGYFVIVSGRLFEGDKVKEVRNVALGLLIVSIICYGISFVIPGHINRAVSTEYGWIKDFGSWSVPFKILRGFTSTVAFLLFDKCTLIMLFEMLLAVLSVLKKRICGVLIPILNLLLYFTCADKGIIQIEYLVDFDYDINKYSLPLIVGSVIIVVLMFVSLVLLIEDRLWMGISCMILMAASLTREMLGFHEGLYGCNARTFTIFLFVVIFICMLLSREVLSKVDELFSAKNL